MDPRFQQFNPESAATFLVRVAEAACTLAEQDENPKPNRIVLTVLEHREKTLAFGAAMRTGLPQPQKQFVFRSPPESATQGPERPRYGLPRIQPVTRDPYDPPPTVPQDPQALLRALSDLPGTATGPSPLSGDDDD